MSSSNLIRWSGLAAVVGGVLLAICDVLNAILFPGEPSSDVMTTSLWFVVQVLGLVGVVFITLGLVGLYARQAKRTGILGLIAFVVAFSGTLMVFGLLWGEPFLGPGLAKSAPEALEVEPTGVMLAGVIFTFVLFTLGWFLVGLVSIQANLLPRGAAVLLMVGAVLFIILTLLELPLWSIVLDVAVAWLGYALWSSSGEPAMLSEMGR
jgi:hypothetical protein